MVRLAAATAGWTATAVAMVVVAASLTTTTLAIGQQQQHEAVVVNHVEIVPSSHQQQEQEQRPVRRRLNDDHHNHRQLSDTTKKPCKWNDIDLLLTLTFENISIFPLLLQSIPEVVPCYASLVIVTTFTSHEKVMELLPPEIPEELVKIHLLNERRHPLPGAGSGIYMVEQMITLHADEFTTANRVLVIPPNVAFAKKWNPYCFLDPSGKVQFFCESFVKDQSLVDGRFKRGAEYALDWILEYDCSGDIDNVGQPVLYPRIVFSEVRLRMEQVHELALGDVIASYTTAEASERGLFFSATNILSNYALKFFPGSTRLIDPREPRYKLKGVCVERLGGDELVSLGMTSTNGDKEMIVIPPNTAMNGELHPPIEGCPKTEVDLNAIVAACPYRDQDCVTAYLWSKRPLVYLPTDADVMRGYPWVDHYLMDGDNKEYSKFPVQYRAVGEGVGKPYGEDRQRTLILTQPKVGTGSLWNAMEPISDFMVRTHEVSRILQPDSLWVLLPGCQAKPWNGRGRCTAFMALRDPKDWLVSTYFELESKTLCDENRTPLTEKGEIRAYYDWLFQVLKDPKNEPFGWWSVTSHLRQLGVPPGDIRRIYEDMVRGDGVKIFHEGELPYLPPWMEGCEVVLVQTEKMIRGSSAETKIQEHIHPNFHFPQKEEIVSREEFCSPNMAKTIHSIKKAKLPGSMISLFSSSIEDWGDVWDVYHGDNQKTYI